MRPHLVRWVQEYGPDGLVVIEINDGRIDSLGAVQGHVVQDDPPYLVVHDGQGAVTGRFGVTAYPTGYVVDRSGRIVWAGFPSSDPEAVEAAIARALRSDSS